MNENDSITHEHENGHKNEQTGEKQTIQDQQDIDSTVDEKRTENALDQIENKTSNETSTSMIESSTCLPNDSIENTKQPET